MADVVQNAINISIVVDWIAVITITITLIIIAGLVRRWAQKRDNTLYLSDEQMDILLKECNKGGD